jgi:hypothetical protein
MAGSEKNNPTYPTSCQQLQKLKSYCTKEMDGKSVIENHSNQTRCGDKGRNTKKKIQRRSYFDIHVTSCRRDKITSKRPNKCDSQQNDID